MESSELRKRWYDLKTERERTEQVIRALPSYESIVQLTARTGTIYPHLLELFEQASRLGLLRFWDDEGREPFLRALAVSELGVVDETTGVSHFLPMFAWINDIEGKMEGNLLPYGFHYYCALSKMRRSLSHKERQLLHDGYTQVLAQLPAVDWEWVSSRYNSVEPSYSFRAAGLEAIANDFGMDADLSISDERSQPYLLRYLYELKGRYLGIFAEKHDTDKHLSLVKAIANEVNYPMHENIDCQQIFRWGLACLYNEITLNLVEQLASNSLEEAVRRVTEALIKTPTPVASILRFGCYGSDPLLRSRCAYILGERREVKGLEPLVQICDDWHRQRLKEADPTYLREVILAIGKIGRPEALRYLTAAFAEQRVDPSLEAACSEALDNMARSLGLESYNFRELREYLSSNHQALVRLRHRFYLLSISNNPEEVLVMQKNEAYRMRWEKLDLWTSEWDAQSGQWLLVWDTHIWDRYKEHIVLPEVQE